MDHRPPLLLLKWRHSSQRISIVRMRTIRGVAVIGTSSTNTIAPTQLCTILDAHKKGGAAPCHHASLYPIHCKNHETTITCTCTMYDELCVCVCVCMRYACVCVCVRACVYYGLFLCSDSKLLKDLIESDVRILQAAEPSE